MPERIAREWNALVEKTSTETRNIVHTIVHTYEDELKQRYRAYLEGDPDLLSLIGEDANLAAFTARFMEWVQQLVNREATSGEIFFSQQDSLGETMARIGFPPHAVSRSIRKIKLWFLRHLSETDVSRQQLVDAMAFIIGLFDIALEIREASYQKGVASNARVNEAYRLHLLGQNLAMERERQRAALMEWGHGLLASFYQSASSAGLPRLWKSELGLWLNHKAHILFEREPKLELIKTLVTRIDNELVPALERVSFNDRSQISDAARKIEEELSAIKFLLSGIFEAHIEVESGRDPLTQLLTRRFMPSVLMREIQLQKMSVAGGFCVLLLDIDHFKRINDTHGHKVGDQALRSVAVAITETVRQTDFVFRYGGEEMLIVLVECDEGMGLQVAEKIRAEISSLSVPLADGGRLAVTASIGVAAFQVELDYERILARADKAVYAAKESGRNRVRLASAS
ncbi:GGDEF domain-containing protein [Rhizobium sp. P38BS-XIX]|uniref:GGDEF domain-containing protein n=1 Tax=Rhizobium sp. P38BS-XIX TaxID=2726740 RepID=UPI00145643FD|nr:GGDEF domain-containing protein [Rhizobium sp. P38BS-XIX]NLS01131.1 GGDEF domain-containing protein [Rhizobium sp. P38BS-XIX]